MGKQRASGQQAYKNVTDAFRSAYRRSGPPTFQKAAGLTTDAAPVISAAALGHPEYLDLKPGETRTANAVISFVDIRGFTKISFVISPQNLLRIVQALTEASIKVINDGGGYIGEFTGDGVMAYFGESSMTDAEATLAALETTALLFKTVDEIVNPELKDEGIDPIRIAAGMEYGEVLWSRVGTAEASQIKPIATATLLAGKLSSGLHTHAWECKLGGELAKWIPDEYKTKVAKYGPFTVNGKEISRELYLLDWRAVANDALQNEPLLEQRVRSRRGLFAGAAGLGTTTTKVVDPPKPGSPGPRPLKDRPFFGE